MSKQMCLSLSNYKIKGYVKTVQNKIQLDMQFQTQDELNKELEQINDLENLSEMFINVYEIYCYKTHKIQKYVKTIQKEGK